MPVDISDEDRKCQLVVVVKMLRVTERNEVQMTSFSMVTDGFYYEALGRFL